MVWWKIGVRGNLYIDAKTRELANARTYREIRRKLADFEIIGISKEALPELPSSGSQYIYGDFFNPFTDAEKEQARAYAIHKEYERKRIRR